MSDLDVLICNNLDVASKQLRGHNICIEYEAILDQGNKKQLSYNGK
jgi:hypothetical protein